jgi:phenylpyruvate tautomerase PptA (4-oxalocrotonate tautomerase family)
MFAHGIGGIRRLIVSMHGVLGMAKPEVATSSTDIVHCIQKFSERSFSMPQAKIFGIREHLVPVRHLLSDAVNESISVAFQFPAERRLQRFFPMDAADFIYPAHERSARYTIIEISTFEGRSKETLKALVRELYRRVPEATGIEPRDLDIIVTEQPRHAWGLMGQPGDEINLSYKVNI